MKKLLQIKQKKYIDWKWTKKKLQTFNSSLFVDQSYFGNDGSQNFNSSTNLQKLLQRFQVLWTQSPNESLKDYQMKKLSPFLQQIIVFLQN